MKLIGAEGLTLAIYIALCTAVALTPIAVIVVAISILANVGAGNLLLPYAF